MKRQTESVIHRIDSFEDYIHLVTTVLDRFVPKAGFEECPVFLFRGHNDQRYDLMPAIGRNRPTPNHVSIMDQERNMIEMAKYKLPDIFNNSLSPIELLALLQHYGIPTRLLDVTENPLVALFFACNSNNPTEEDADGEVIVFEFNDYDISTYPMAQAVAESYKYCNGHENYLEYFFANAKIQPYFLEQKFALGDMYHNNEEGAHWVDNCCQDPILVDAPIHSMRQHNQNGRYLLFPNQIISTDDGTLCFSKIIPSISRDSDLIQESIVIPSEKKKEFLQKLAALGVTKEQLFPDSIDIVCEEIRKKCGEKNNSGIFHADLNISCSST